MLCRIRDKLPSKSSANWFKVTQEIVARLIFQNFQGGFFQDRISLTNDDRRNHPVTGTKGFLKEILIKHLGRVEKVLSILLSCNKEHFNISLLILIDILPYSSSNFTYLMICL
jgi:hypothetical protein